MHARKELISWLLTCLVVLCVQALLFSFPIWCLGQGVISNFVLLYLFGYKTGFSPL